MFYTSVVTLIKSKSNGVSWTILKNQHQLLRDFFVCNYIKITAENKNKNPAFKPMFFPQYFVNNLAL